MVHNIVNVCSNHTMFKLQKRGIPNTQFAVYISDISVTLKQSEGHQTYNGNVNQKQGYKYAKFKRSCFNHNGVLKKPTLLFFLSYFSNKELFQVPPLNMFEKKVVCS